MDVRSSRLEKGFSLLEGMVVIGVISIVMAMAILGFRTILQGSKADSGMDRVLTELRSARERAISHRSEVQVEFLGANQLRLTEIWAVGNPPPPTTVTLEGGAQYTIFGSVPDVPAPYNYGKIAPVFFGGVAGGPPIMKFTTNGAFIDAGNTFLNGTLFLGLPGDPSSARAITVLGPTGRIREYRWNGTAWRE
jgi:prepilin-type N-terminal cleavage/methylation domain-containing protein